MSLNNKKLDDSEQHKSFKRIGRRLLPVVVAVAATFWSVSCNRNVSDYELWQRTEQIKESYNSTYESIESLKEALRGLEIKLKNPNLNDSERRNLEEQKKGIVETIKDLQEDLDEELSDWNKAVKEYLKHSAKHAWDSAKSEDIDSTPNAVDWRLPSLPAPKK